MASARIHFRFAEPGDAAQLQQLIQSAFRAADSRDNWTGSMELASQFTIGVDTVAERLNAPESEMIMAMGDDGTLLGCMEVVKRPNEARLCWLAVDPKVHRGGIGRQIVAYAEDWAQRTWGLSKFSLNALCTREGLISWYERQGYAKTGETKPFPYEAFQGLDLPEGLCFIEFEKEARKNTSTA